MEPRHYRNFTLRVSPVARRPGRYHVQIFGLIPGGQPAADERETMTYDPARFVAGALNLLDAVQFGQMTARQLYALGTALADTLLAGSIRKRWWDSLNVARERRLGLRLRLLFEAPELIALPWEFLYLRPPWENADSDLYFLALQPDVSIVRHEMLDIAEPSLTPQASYRLVAAQASPAGQPELALGAERVAIEAAIARLPQADLLQPAWVEKATRRALREALRTPADILHFSGHGRLAGSGGQIILEREGGGSDPYAATSLASLIQASPLRLAILNACETGARSGSNPWSGVASALVRAGVAAVVASQYPILDTSATPLAEEIYLGVLTGLTIDEAVSNARRAIYQEAGLQIPDWGAPVLYLRAEEGFIFPPVLAPTGAQPAAPQGAGQQISIQVTQTIAGPVTGTVTGVNAGAIGAQVATAVAQAMPGESPRAIPRILPPRQDTPLLGREDELSRAQIRLGAGDKVYFYGTYGVGKTSLAAELYRRLVGQKAFADGCLWDRVSRLSAEKVLDRVAGKFAGQQVAEAAGREEKIQALNDLLAGRNDLLIALDEVDDRAVAQAVLQAAADCTVILNGTQRLNLAGAATERRLQPLGRAVAEELFKTLARPSGAAFSDEEAALVADICRRMRYLPLAVKLAALKYAEGVESLQDLRDRLVSEPESLSPEDGVVAIFAAHYADLKGMPTALNLLVRIASFPALEAPLKALQEGQSDFYSSKDKLVDMGLVDYAGPDRLVLHPLLGNQVQRVEPEAISPERERAARWLADYAKRNREDYDALEGERANLLALLDRYAGERRWDDLVALLRDLFDYLRVRGQWQEALERLDAVVAAAGQETQAWNRGWAYLHRGIMRTLRAEYAPAQADFDQAERLFTAAGDQAYRGKTLYHRANVSILQGALTLARRQLEQAIAWMGDAAPSPDRAGAHERLANLLVTQGKPEAAEPHFEAALALGDAEKQARAHIALGQYARQKGDYQGAEAHLAAAGQLIESINDVLARASLHRELGYVHYYQGRYDDARSAFEQADAIFTDLKYQPGLAQVKQALGNVALAHGQLDEAAGHYGAALQINEARGQSGSAAYNRYQLGVVAQRHQRYGDAREMYRAAGKGAGDMGDIALQAAVQHQLTSLALATGDVAGAIESNQEAIRLARQVSDALTETSALYYHGLLEIRAGNLEAGRQTLAQVHASFAALNSPEADKVATLLAGLGTEGGEAPAGLLAAAVGIDVTKGGALEAEPSIDVIKGEVVGVVEFGAVSDSVQVKVALDIDVVKDRGTIVGAKIDEL